MSPTECLLRAQNYTAAALLLPNNPRAAFWRELAEVWRRRALEVYLSGEFVDLCFKLRATEMTALEALRNTSTVQATRLGSHPPLTVEQLPTSAGQS